MAFFNEFPGNRFYDGDLGWLLRRVHEIIAGLIPQINIKDSSDNTILKAPDSDGEVSANALHLDSYPDREIGAELGTLAYYRDHTVEYTRQNAGGIAGLTAKAYYHGGVVELDISTPIEGLADVLQTSGSYIQFGLDYRMTPPREIYTNILISARYLAQLNIKETGQIQIGYTRNVSDGNPVNIPANTFLRCQIAFLSSYGQEYESSEP